MSSTVTASDGNALPLDSLPTAIVYAGGFVSTLTVQYPNIEGVNKTYVQTFTNDGTNVTNISRWVVQP